VVEAQPVEQGIRDLFRERFVALETERKETCEVPARLLQGVFAGTARRVRPHLLQCRSTSSRSVSFLVKLENTLRPARRFMCSRVDTE